MKIAVSYFDKLDWWPNKNFKGICDSLFHIPCNATVTRYTPEELIHTKDYDAVFLMRGGNALSAEHVRHYKSNGTLVALCHDDIFFWKTRLWACYSKELMRWFDVADIIFTMWAECFLRFRQYRRFRRKLVWLPWSASDSILDTDIEWHSRRDKILLSGNTGKCYPLRRRIADYSVTGAGRELIESIRHYGYRQHSQDKMLTGQAYYDYLKMYKAAVATGGIKPAHYHRAKYMEIAACGCLPFVEYTPDMPYLGFVDAINCVVIDKHNFRQKFALISSDRTNVIANNARELVRKKHLHSHRARTIVSTITNKLELK